jgi:hypothetical protein
MQYKVDISLIGEASNICMLLSNIERLAKQLKIKSDVLGGRVLCNKKIKQ